MRKTLLILFALVMAPGLAFAQQQWEAQGVFPADSSLTGGIHGMAVGPNGNVFVQKFSGGTIFVYQPDGTPVDTVQTLTINGTQETLTQGRGLGTDANGNILIANGPILYRMNATTLAGVSKTEGFEGSLSAPRGDANGNIFTALVAPGNGPMRIYDQDMNFVENVVDTTRGFSRSFGVTADGNTVYWAGYSNFEIRKFTRPDEFSPFNAVPDTLFKGIGSEAIARNPATGHIWISNGISASGVPSGVFASEDRNLMWFAVDPATDAIVDSLQWSDPNGTYDPGTKPRAIAFSPDGKSAYVGVFDAGPSPSVQKFVLMDRTAIDRDPTAVPESFTLHQNYPNPFNPSTSIRFDLVNAGHASLKVYDVLGREVATLVDERLTAGSYTQTFRADGLASGTYLYVLTLNGQRQSGTMLLMK